MRSIEMKNKINYAIKLHWQSRYKQKHFVAPLWDGTNHWATSLTTLIGGAIVLTSLLADTFRLETMARTLLNILDTLKLMGHLDTVTARPILIMVATALSPVTTGAYSQCRTLSTSWKLEASPSSYNSRGAQSSAPSSAILRLVTHPARTVSR